MKLAAFYDSARQRIEQCSAEDKRLAFEALAPKVTATPEHVDVIGVIPIEITTEQSSGLASPLLTIARTWGYLIEMYYEYPSGRENSTILLHM